MLLCCCSTSSTYLLLLLLLRLLHACCLGLEWSEHNCGVVATEAEAVGDTSSDLRTTYSRNSSMSTKTAEQSKHQQSGTQVQQAKFPAQASTQASHTLHCCG
jgi:hypothetical protein